MKIMYALIVAVLTNVHPLAAVEQVKAPIVPNVPQYNSLGNNQYVLSAQGCWDPTTNSYIGIDEKKNKTTYHVSKIVKAVFLNLQSALKSAHLRLSHLNHVNVYMTRDKDYDTLNEVWNQLFPDENDAPTRTVLFVNDFH